MKRSEIRENPGFQPIGLHPSYKSFYTGSHSGVRSEFSKLAKEEPRIDKSFSAFLAHAYTLKEVADYEMGPGSDIPPERSAAAIETATRFVDVIAGLIGEGQIHSA